MLRVSIISLIYQSATLADAVYDSVHRFTPMIGRGEAEFFFVANDPHPALLAHLRRRGYQHIVNSNRRYSAEELFELGYAGPEYMSRVYRGYNVGVQAARADLVVLINSDNFFSPDWLENLIKYSDRNRVISSTLVERLHPTFKTIFPGALHGEFGGTAATFDEAAFLSLVARVKKTGLEAGGGYMPCLIHRDVALEVGLYPSGNIAGRTFDHVAQFGDEEFFARLQSVGVSHFTALDSISYHLKEGERADAPTSDENADAASSASADASMTPAVSLPIKPSITRVRDSMAPNRRHEELLSSLVADYGEAPSTRTMRQLVASGLLDPEIDLLTREEIARRDEAGRLAAQATRVRAMVARVVGERRTESVMRLIHKVSWLVRPIRRALARRSSAAQTRGSRP